MDMLFEVRAELAQASGLLVGDNRLHSRTRDEAWAVGAVPVGRKAAVTHIQSSWLHACRSQARGMGCRTRKRLGPRAPRRTFRWAGTDSFPSEVRVPGRDRSQSRSGAPRSAMLPAVSEGRSSLVASGPSAPRCHCPFPYRLHLHPTRYPTGHPTGVRRSPAKESRRYRGQSSGLRRRTIGPLVSPLTQRFRLGTGTLRWRESPV